MKTLILADNQAVTRLGMKWVALAEGRSDAEIKEAGSLHELSVLLLSYPNAVVVVDYTLFDCTADQLWVLKERFSESVFVLFSDALSEDFLRRMVFGSSYFSVLLKDSALPELIECLEKAEGGEQFVCSKVKSWLYAQEQKTICEVSPLTATEKEILRALALGKSTKEIAAERFLSVYTVMTHRKNIFRKLKVNNAQEAVRYALRAGIVDMVEYCI